MIAYNTSSKNESPKGKLDYFRSIFFGCLKRIQFLIPTNIFGLFFHVSDTPPWLIRSVKTRSELYADCFLFLTFARLFANCAAPVLLMVHHSTTVVTISLTRRQRTSLGLANILRMCLCSHALLTCYQNDTNR